MVNRLNFTLMFELKKPSLKYIILCYEIIFIDLKVDLHIII